jgi:phospholipid/cholesterol/gamma-HCH transport system substrate-binding protein
MRRSVREAIVGFSLLAAITSAIGLSLWLRGLSLTRQFWTVEARFAEASGLAVRSPVVFRGVVVGSVRSVRIAPEAVIAVLEITNPSIRLAQPTVAEIGQVSLLGGEAQVVLVSQGEPLPADAPSPRSRDCDGDRMLCDGATISGSQGASLASVTTMLYQLLSQADEQQLMSKVAGVATSVEATAKEADAFLKDSRGLVKDGTGLLRQGQSLVGSLEGSVQDVQPSIANLNASSAQLRQLMERLDDPRLVADLQQTVANAERLTAQWRAVGGDVQKLTGDPTFINGLRSLAVGLGAFFEELYPARTGAARERAEREAGGEQGDGDGGGDAAPAESGPGTGAGSSGAQGTTKRGTSRGRAPASGSLTPR